MLLLVHQSLTICYSADNPYQNQVIFYLFMAVFCKNKPALKEILDYCIITFEFVYVEFALEEALGTVSFV